MSDKFFLNDYRLQGINFDNFYFQDVISSVYLRGQAAAEFLRPQRLPFRGHDRERRQSHVAGRRRAGARLQSRHQRSRRPHLRDWRRAYDRHQRRQHRPDQRGFPIHRPADLRQRLSPLQCLRDAGRRHLREHLFSRQMLVARHCRRLYAGDRTTLLAALLHRSHRRSVEAVPVRPPRRRGDRAQRNRIDHLRQRCRREHRRQFEPGGVLRRVGPGRFRARDGRRRPRIPLSVRLDSSWGTQTITPIAQFIARPNEVIPRLQPDEDSQSLVFDETNLFAWNKFSGYDRVEGGTRLNYGAAVHRRLRQRRARQFRRRRIDPGRRAEFLHALRSRQHRPGIPVWTRNSPTSSSARRCSRPRTRLR